jgi:hypothetical protein
MRGGKEKGGKRSLQPQKISNLELESWSGPEGVLLMT